MKNKITIIIIALISIAIIGGISFTVLKNNHNKNNSESKLISIDVLNLEEKINNKDSFVLVMSQTGCSHCEQYLPELSRTLEEVNLEAYVINITNLDKEQTEKLNKMVHFSGTPTTIFYHDGIEATTLNRISGYANKSKIIERLKSLGYIN